MNPLDKIRILVVEDEPVVQDLIKNILDAFGFKKVAVTQDGESALKKMRLASFDLVITDWHMEPMNGLELVCYLRNDENSPDKFIPIIMLSGKAERYQIEEARDAGITEFIAKPFTIEMFKERIIAVIESPRDFVIAEDYSGPSRRRRDKNTPEGIERRSDV